MKKRLTSIAAALLFAVSLAAQPNQPQAPADRTPQLEYVLTLHVSLDAAYSVGQTPHGQRQVIPITGGTFEGPNIKGTIIPGGADYQLADKASGRTDVEAIYSIKTDDGVNIHVRNTGIISMSQSGFYFFTTPKFEAPSDSKYAWLNNAIYVCTPDFGAQGGGITLKVWKVK